MTFPHFAVSLALLLAVHGAVLADQVQENRRKLWVAPALFAALGFIHVYDLFPAVAAWVLWLLIGRARPRATTQQDREPVRWRRLLLAGLGALIPIIFYWSLTRSSPALANWNATNQMPSPAFPQYLVALGIPGLLAILFIARNTQHWRSDPWLRLLVCWFLVTIPLLYSAPIFPFERRFMEGWWIPTALLALCALDPRHSRDARNWRKTATSAGAAIAAVILSLPGGVHKLGLAMEKLDDPKAPYYRDEHWEATCDFLRHEVPREGTTVLSSHKTGLYLPTCSLQFTYIGHPQLTPDHGRRAYEATQFMNAFGERAERLQLLKRAKVTHIVRYADGDQAWFEALERHGVIEQKFVSGPGVVYAVKAY
jgi:hypothetical protein